MHAAAASTASQRPACQRPASAQHANAAPACSCASQPPTRGRALAHEDVRNRAHAHLAGVPGGQDGAHLRGVEEGGRAGVPQFGTGGSSASSATQGQQTPSHRRPRAGSKTPSAPQCAETTGPPNSAARARLVAGVHLRNVDGAAMNEQHHQGLGNRGGQALQGERGDGNAGQPAGGECSTPCCALHCPTAPRLKPHSGWVCSAAPPELQSSCTPEQRSKAAARQPPPPPAPATAAPGCPPA